MQTLYDKKSSLKIRNKYRKNIEKRYGIVDNNYQRCHIFGLREAKYLELVCKLDNVDNLVKLLTWDENVLFLTFDDHRLFESNKLDFTNVELSTVQKKLLDLAILVRNTKFRVYDEEFANNVYQNILYLIK